jgi:predicted oxidoreductase
MQHYRIPNTDLEVSRIAFGTWHLGETWDKTPPTDEIKVRANALVKAAYEHGINHIDLADIYTLGKSDELVGYALKQNPGLREKLILQEKGGIIVGADPDFGPPSRFDFSYEHLVKSVETDLKRLGTDYVDLFTLHRPDILVEPEEVAKAFDYLHAQGMVRYFGVSNHNAAQLELLRKHVRQPFVLNQLELNIMHHFLISNGMLVNQTAAQFANATGVLEYCRLHDIMIQAWSPLARGQLIAPKPDAPQNVKNTAALVAELAAKKNTTKEGVALAWLLRHPAMIQPILGTHKVDHIANAVAADTVELSRQEWYSLLEAARGAGVP